MIPQERKEIKSTPMLEKFAAQSLVEYDGEIIFSKENFARLVAEHEREECAKLCEEMAVKDNLTNYYKVAAHAIRAKGQEK